MKNKLFVLSLDALVHEDIAYLMTKPNFSAIMGKRAEVEQVQSVFPAITYPAHATLMTGCNPGKHGIYNNTPLFIHKDGKTHWYLDYKSVRVENLFAAAKRAGCTTASVYWPITANDPNVDHIINEYFFFYPEEDSLEAFRKMGADEAALQAVREHLDELNARRMKIGDTTYDNFLMNCTCSLIRNVQPDVMLVHNCAPDTARHRHGVFSKGLEEALDRVDVQLGKVVDAMKEAGVYEQTNFVILSDHGQLDKKRTVRLNVLLAEGGFIEMAPDGTLYDWRAWAQSNGMSASIYLRDPENKKLYAEVEAFLQKLVDDEKWGLTRVYKTEEVREKYGTYGPFSFMVATDAHTSVNEGLGKEPVEFYFEDQQGGLHGAHGHEPELGPQPVFLAHGPAFKEGATLPRAELCDIAPTLAKALGQELPEAEGRILTELLK